MKKSNIFIAALLALALTSCIDWGKGGDGQGENPEVDTVQIVPDSTVWGHLGEDSGMSVFEFITQQGDTLYIRRTSEYTGQEAEVLGEVRNFTDQWAFVLSDNDETLRRGINYTQLQQMLDGQVQAEYRLWNGYLIFDNIYKSETGQDQLLSDTSCIDWLDQDSLVYTDHNKVRQRVTREK